MDERESVDYEMKEDPVYATQYHSEMEIFLLTAEEIEALRTSSRDGIPERI